MNDTANMSDLEFEGHLYQLYTAHLEAKAAFESIGVDTKPKPPGVLSLSGADKFYKEVEAWNKRHRAAGELVDQTKRQFVNAIPGTVLSVNTWIKLGDREFHFYTHNGKREFHVRNPNAR